MTTSRLQSAREAARKELGEAADAWDVKELGLWLAQLDALQAKLDAGKAVDVNDTARVVAALQAVRDRCKSAAAPAPKLELSIVERALEYTCKHCGRLN